MIRKTQSLAFATFGIFLTGIGGALNKCAGLGNDPVGIVYDGIRNVADLKVEHLGTASFVVNVVLIIMLFFVGRRYVNAGTVISVLTYGPFVGLGTRFYLGLNISDTLLNKCITSAAGCILLYMGIAIFITMDIGVDPFTGVVMVIRDKTGWNYRRTKVLFDISMIILGMLLGGESGAITFITAISAGPVIQFFISILKKQLVKRGEKFV